MTIEPVQGICDLMTTRLQISCFSHFVALHTEQKPKNLFSFSEVYEYTVEHASQEMTRYDIVCLIAWMNKKNDSCSWQRKVLINVLILLYRDEKEQEIKSYDEVRRNL